MHDTGQVITDRVQVDPVLQPRRERGHGLVGVIPGPVEPPVYHLLHPPPERVEQGRRQRWATPREAAAAGRAAVLLGDYAGAAGPVAPGQRRLGVPVAAALEGGLSCLLRLNKDPKS